MDLARNGLLEPLLSRIAKDYLHQNALAHQNGKKTFDYRGATFELGNTTTYRVWCREVLQNITNLHVQFC